MSVAALPVNLNTSGANPIRVSPGAGAASNNVSNINSSSINNTSGPSLISQVPQAGLQNEDGDSVTISKEGQQRLSQEENKAADEKKAENKESTENSAELDESEKELVDRLEKRDQEVRTHEQAHLTSAGSLANGAPKYEYQRGPDGKQYAIGGSVDIDVSKVPNDPEATIQKMDKVKRAALAPAEPSGKDRQVASRAEQVKAEARQELNEQRLEEVNGNGEEKTTNTIGTATNQQEEENKIGTPQKQNEDKQKQFFGFNPNFTYNFIGQSATPRGVGNGFSVNDVF